MLPLLCHKALTHPWPLGFVHMKSLKIAASHDVVATLSTHREVVALDSTDFTDIAAVVLSVADSRSGILALLKRTGFSIPVFLAADARSGEQEGITGLITGKAQDYLELETAATDYEEGLLPPFFDTLTKYVAM